MKTNVVLVILAAGVGKRFWPLTRDKNLFPFMGKTYIDYTIPEVFPEEISQVVVVANKRNRLYFEHKQFPVPHVVVEQEVANGMAGAIVSARKYITGKRICIVIADDIFDQSLYRRLFLAKKEDTKGIIVGWKVPHFMRLGYLRLENNKPVGIVEKPEESQVPSPYVYFGLQYIEDATELLNEIDAVESTEDNVYELALTSLMKRYEFSFVPYEGEFLSLKYCWSVLGITEYLLHHKLIPHQGKNVDIRHNVSISGPVYIGDNVKIFENTKIVGPVFIGDNTIIGNNNMIRDSMIGENCVTGFNTDITRSYIGDNCWFHNNYIGDSVLEKEVSMGGGSLTANFRLDEGGIYSHIGDKRIATNREKLGTIIGSTVRIGVNTSIMPGIKIGSGSLIGAGIVLDKDIPNESFVSLKSSYEVKKNLKKIDTNNREKHKNKI